MKLYIAIISSLLSNIILQRAEGQRKKYSYQQLPLDVKIGECFNFTATSYYSTISRWSKDIEIVWRKDTHKTTYQNASFYVGYATAKDAAYYEVVVYNKTHNIEETTDFWANLIGCQSNEKESPETSASCKSSCVSMCPSGWNFFQSSSAVKKCYKYFSDLKSWTAAENVCQGIGGQLARVENSEENTFVGNLLTTAEGAWIGLNDRLSESSFFWNSEKTKSPTFMAWAPSEPNNYNNKCNIENCAMINKQTGTWSDVICNSFHPFACEGALRNVSGWTCTGSKCHRFFDQPLMWQDALSFCKSLDSNLPSINSNNENGVVAGIIKRDSWIGLNDITEAGNFVWNEIRYSNQKLSYTNWAKNEPNDMIFDKNNVAGCPGEDCVLVRAWQSKVLWYDLTCDAGKPYICERIRDRLISSGVLVGIVIGSLIFVVVVGGILNAGMKKRNSAQIKAIMLSVYEQDHEESQERLEVPRTASFKNVVQSFSK